MTSKLWEFFIHLKSDRYQSKPDIKLGDGHLPVGDQAEDDTDDKTSEPANCRKKRNHTSHQQLVVVFLNNTGILIFARFT